MAPPTLHSGTLPDRPLECGVLVEIHAGLHRGRVGIVSEQRLSAKTGAETVLILTQDGRWIWSKREDLGRV